MARVAGIELPRNKRIEIALTYIFGIGRTAANKILAKANVDPAIKSDDLTADDQVVIAGQNRVHEGSLVEAK